MGPGVLFLLIVESCKVLCFYSGHCSGHCMGTVRALYGHCTGTVRCEQFVQGRKICMSFRIIYSIRAVMQVAREFSALVDSKWSFTANDVNLAMLSMRGYRGGNK